MLERLSRHRKTLIKTAITIVPVTIILCLLELAAYIIIVVNNSNFYLPLELNELRNGPVQARENSLFSHELGWERTYRNDYGYRGEEKNIDNAAIAVFGDSFTLGYPVIEQSWPYLLEQQLNRPVLNFGVAGYGTDQAYLRFEKRYVNQLQTPYVALLVQSENIARVMNRYRGFYRRKHNAGLTKPMFQRHEDGTIRLLPNPLQSVDDIPMLGNMQFLNEIGEQDYWYQYFELLDLNHFVDFPYSYYLLKALPYYIKRGYQHRIQNHRVYENMYQEHGPTEILHFIITTFINRAEKVRAVPIIVFLPNSTDMVDFQNTGSTLYYDFYHELKTDHYTHVYDALTYFMPFLEQGETVSTFFRSRLDGHYSPEAERLVSAGLYQTLMSIESHMGLLGLSE